MIDQNEALISFFNNLITTSKVPLANPIKSLPYSAVKNLINKHMQACKTSLTQDNHLVADIDLNELIDDANQMAKNLYIPDELGLLILSQVPKSIICTLLNVSSRTVQQRRALLNAPEPKSGRPKQLDPFEISYITGLWNKQNGTNTQRLLSIHYSTEMDIVDIWSVVKPLINQNQTIHTTQQLKACTVKT